MPDSFSSRRNIRFFFVDDMRYGDASSHNPHGKIQTPHLDRLAGDGMVFTDAHSSFRKKSLPKTKPPSSMN